MDIVHTQYVPMYVVCCICQNLRAFWGDQTDPKSAGEEPILILRTGAPWPRCFGVKNQFWPEKVRFSQSYGICETIPKMELLRSGAEGFFEIGPFFSLFPMRKPFKGVNSGF